MPHEISDSEQAEYEPSPTWATALAGIWRKPPLMHIRIALVFYGIIVPIACHLLTINGAPNFTEWQSGELSDKLGFVLSGGCGWPIFPFLIFAMVCMGMVAWNEAEATSKPWVRFGIFSGVFVCAWYLFAFSLTVLGGLASIIGLMLGSVVWLVLFHGSILGLQILWARFGGAVIAAIFCVAFTLMFACAAAVAEGVWVILLFPIIPTLNFSTPVAFSVYLGVSIRILKIHPPARRFTLSQLMIWVTWFATFVSAVRSTIKLSYQEYLKLPLEPPDNCYVATAASKGYPGMVGSQNLSAFADQSVVVNQQLATFKAAELALRAVWPSGHRAFRYFYNRFGPRAAAMLRGPLIATAAYLSLKPAEWLCGIVLRILLGKETFQLSKKLYLGRVQSNRNPNA